MSGLGGLYGWQWLFILEGVPTVIIGVLIWVSPLLLGRR
jgi:hypothetical protein